MKATLSQKKVLPTVRETSVAVLDHEDDVKSGLAAVERRRSLQVAAVFEAGFKTTETITKVVVADPGAQGTKGVPKPRDLGLVMKGVHPDELRDFTQRMENDNTESYAACAAKKLASAEKKVCQKCVNFDWKRRLRRRKLRS